MVKNKRLKRRIAAGKVRAAEGSVTARRRRRRRGLRPGLAVRFLCVATVARGWESATSCWWACRISGYKP